MQKGTDRTFRFVPFYFKSAALPKNFIAFFKQLIIMQTTLILCKNGQNRYPTLPKCLFLHKKMREIVLISLKFVVHQKRQRLNPNYIFVNGYAGFIAER